ncbi:MAG: hypothetical protein ACP5LQ_09460 [Candidatus Methanodesulfokora sp.]
MSVRLSRVKSIAELLAVLVTKNKSYTYVDKLGYALSKDLMLYYLREVLRDFHSLKQEKRGEEDWIWKNSGQIRNYIVKSCR